MAHNSVTVGDNTFERKGKRMAFVTVFEKTDGDVRVEWASTRELAEKNAASHINRWNKAKAGQQLGWPWSTESYLGYADIRIEPTIDLKEASAK